MRLKKRDCFKHYLPLDARTLLHTPRTIFVRKINLGEYHHFGIKSGIFEFFKKHPKFVGPINVSFQVQSDVYNHFVTLHVAISLLSVEDQTSKNIDYSEKLLHHFVKSFGTIYGVKYISHNIHGLIHLFCQMMLETMEHLTDFLLSSLKIVCNNFLRCYVKMKNLFNK